MITVHLVEKPEELAVVFQIRKTVFVDEQHVDERDEYDEFEPICRHFLALSGDDPCGTARWRFTENGVKMERFAVLSPYRSQKVGSALMQAVLDDIQRFPLAENKKRYLNAQLTAMPLYQKFGFIAEGDLFYECGIAHYKMTLS